MLSVLTIIVRVLSKGGEMMSYTLENIIEELYILHKLHKQCVSSQLSELTLEQGKLLYLIKDKRMNQRELALALRISEATLSVRIKRLLDAGYIERTVDEHDKRIFMIGLSTKGQKEVVDLEKKLTYYYRRLSEDITQEEIEIIIRVIHKMKKNIKEEME